jgi:16S rRNA (guanine966-N2)-methyltransferase
MDRVKAAIFSSLADFLEGARVLDLFAGTGALGIEALSRGAARVTFVDNDRHAVELIKRNLSKTRLPGLVHMMDIFSFLDRCAKAGSFDLIFADPPYAKKKGERDFAPELLASASLRRVLAPHGIFVLEHLPGARLPLGENWEQLRQKRYGATEVAFLRHQEKR